MRRLTLMAVISAATLSACATTQPEAPVIVIPPEPIQTCAPVATLKKVVIPAETRTQTAITQIENPPYDPIETRVERTIIVKPAQVMYVNDENKEVLDICEDDIEIGATGPSEGAVLNDQGEVIFEE